MADERAVPVALLTQYTGWGSSNNDGLVSVGTNNCVPVVGVAEGKLHCLM